MTPDARVDRLEEAMARMAEAQARADERFARLEAAVERLAEAQARTEARLEALAAAQARTEERVTALEAAVARLAEAQARTEERVTALEAAVARLAEAQARTEARVETLAAAQARTEVAVAQLAHQVGRLSDTIGFTLEDLAREVSPAYLAHHYGIQDLEVDRRFFSVDGEEVEVDFCGDGRRDGERVTVVGEVRSRIYGRDVEAAVRRLERLAPQLSGKPIAVLFGFVIHPSAREAASRLGAIVISSSGR